jgi:ABC-type glycerol-3-phosphate transport system permease component
MAVRADVRHERYSLAATRAAARRRRPRRRWGTIARHVVLIAFSLAILGPLAWVVLLSVKSIPDAYTNRIWPEVFDLSHYGFAVSHITTLPQNMLNSVVVTVGTVVVATVCAVLAGYALVHVRMAGRALVVGFLAASLFFPTRVTGLIAIWEIQRNLDLLNVAYALILPYSTLALALSVLVMRGVFQTIPRELPEAARIDGCGNWSALWHVMLPLVRNGIVVVIVVNFVAAWGEFLLANTLMTDQDQRTLPVVLASASGGMGQWAWPRIAAVYVMAITPALVAFAIAQRWYMRGLQEGALKA